MSGIRLTAVRPPSFVEALAKLLAAMVMIAVATWVVYLATGSMVIAGVTYVIATVIGAWLIDPTGSSA